MRALLVILLLGASTSAAAQDYDPKSRAWNGSSYLLETAAEARVSLHVADAIDWGTLDPDTILVLVGTTVSPDTDSVLSFLEDGGHVVVADDFGATDAILDRVGIHKVTGVLRHDSFLDDDPSFPVFEPEAEHFLFFNIRGVGSRIVGNHPTAFELGDGATPILRYAGGAAFIAEARVGRGALLAVADGSVFINEMLHQHGDKQLAANLLRYYCTGQTCDVTLVTPGARWVGTYEPQSARDASTLHGLFRESVSVINTFVARVARSMGEGPLLRILLVLTLGALCVAAARLMRRAPAHPPVPAVPDTLTGTTEMLAAGLSMAPHHADFRDAAGALSAIVSRALGRLRLSPASNGPSDVERSARALAARVHPRDPAARDALRLKVLNILSLSASLRNSAAGNGPPRAISASEFEALDDDARHILRAIAGLRSGVSQPSGPTPPPGSGGAGT